MEKDLGGDMPRQDGASIPAHMGQADGSVLHRAPGLETTTSRNGVDVVEADTSAVGMPVGARRVQRWGAAAADATDPFVVASDARSFLELPAALRGDEVGFLAVHACGRATDR